MKVGSSRTVLLRRGDVFDTADAVDPFKHEDILWFLGCGISRALLSVCCGMITMRRCAVWFRESSPMGDSRTLCFVASTYWIGSDEDD